MIYGYARVSTKGQDRYGNGLEVQEKQLRDNGAETIFYESFTGTKKHRPELDKLTSLLKAGDTVMVTKLDRIARSTRDGLEIIDDLLDTTQPTEDRPDYSDSAFVGEWKAWVSADTIETIRINADGTGTLASNDDDGYEFTWTEVSEDEINIIRPSDDNAITVKLTTKSDLTVLEIMSWAYYRSEDFDAVLDEYLSSFVELPPENEYLIVENIDFSECELTNGFITGWVSFTGHTTQKYVDEYGDLFYREIYFEIYDENGKLIGNETAQDNFLYNRDYTSDGSFYVFIASDTPIADIKVSKIVCEPQW